MTVEAKAGGGWVFEPGPRPGVPVEGRAERFPVHRIYCVGQNYAEHAREMGSSGREPPVFFDKPADAVTTSRQIPYPPRTQNLHHEAELVVDNETITLDTANTMLDNTANQSPFCGNLYVSVFDNAVLS